jgi:hypothetical protein
MRAPKPPNELRNRQARKPRAANKRLHDHAELTDSALISAPRVCHKLVAAFVFMRVACEAPGENDERTPVLAKRLRLEGGSVP